MIMKDMNKALEILKEVVRADYENFFNRNGERELGTYAEEQLRDFDEKWQVNFGKKYIKIIKDRAVWGFIVNVENDKKFKYGDILKAAGYNAPARNAARGNVFENYEVRWTGPLYL
jgi:hypothetical protein